MVVAGPPRVIPFLFCLGALLAAMPAAAGDLVQALQPGSRAAPGLGGDPFLSPLEDGDGWWASFPWSSGRSLRMDAVSGQLLTESGADHRGRAHDTRLALTLVGARDAGPLRLRAGLREESRTWDYRWRADNADATLGHDGRSLAGALRAETRAPGLVMQGVLPTPGAGSIATAGAGMRLIRGEGLAAQGSVTRGRVPDALLTSFRGERVDGSLNLRADTWRADLRIRPRRSLEAEASGSSAFLGPIAPRDAAYVYEHLPRGHVFAQQASLACGPAGARVLARWTRTDLDAGDLGVWGGQSYGEVTLLHGGATAWLGAAEWRDRAKRRWLADVEHVRLEGRAHGYVESWPFTSIVVDLLGLQGVADAVASAAWWRVHAALELPLRPRLLAWLGASGYDARPSARLTTYETGIGGIGVQNAHQTSLSITRVQLAALSLGGAGTVARFAWSAQLRQFVYARSVSARAASSGGGANTRGPGSAGTRGWPGGTQAEGSLRCAW